VEEAPQWGPVGQGVYQGYVEQHTGDTSDTNTYSDGACVQDKRTRIAQASRSARLKRKNELEVLRKANEKLSVERIDMIKKIDELEYTLKDELGQATIEDLHENGLLKREIALYKQFVDSFSDMVGKSPSEDRAKQLVFKEAVESAHGYFLAILAQSQQNFRRAKVTPRVKECSTQPDIFFSLTDNVFEAPSRSSTKSKKSRLNFRVDSVHPGLSVNYVSKMMERFFGDDAVKKELCGISDDKVQQVVLDTPNSNTRLLYHKRKYETEEDRNVVFLLNSRKHTMARSTLAKPSHKIAGREKVVKPDRGGVSPQQKRRRGRPVGTKKTPISSFGQVEATFITKTSTSILPGVTSLPDDSDNKRSKRISSLVIQGSIVFEEEVFENQGDDDEEPPKCIGKVTKSIFVSSTPREFNEQPMFDSPEKILRHDGTLTEEFATFFAQVADKFNLEKL